MNGVASPKKRIIIFSTAYIPLIGGAEVAVYEITKRLSEYRFDLITARLRKELPTDEQIGPVHVHRVGIGHPLDKFLLPFLGLRFAVQLHHRYMIDGIWSVMASFGGIGALFFKRCFPSIPLLLTLQEGDSEEHIRARAGIFWFLIREIFKSADGLQAISQYLLAWGKQMGFRGSKAVVIPNGVDVEKFEMQTEKLKIKEEVYRKTETPPYARVVITVSRLVKKNGIEDLIDALRYLSADTVLWIVGEGELASPLREKTIALGLEDRVKFLGAVDHTALPLYLHGADVFCRPSLSEGLGNAFLEAMAAKTPVVGTAVGGIPDFLQQGVTGFFCQATDPKDIARAIQDIFDQPERTSRIVSAARRLVEKQYSWEVVARQMRTFLQTIL